jgi:hypothetical protein
MKVDVPCDYALPFMATQKALREIQEAMLEKDYLNATIACTHAMVELKLVLNCIKHEEEECNKRSTQAD